MSHDDNRITIGNETFDYDPSLFDDKAKLTADQEKELLTTFVKLAVETAYNSLSAYTGGGGGENGYRTVMSSLELLFRESYKFIRLSDDLHVIKDYLNDIRICFIAMTISIYFGILIYMMLSCLKRKRATDLERADRLRNVKEDEALFAKWAGHRSPSIRQQEHRESEEVNEVTTFYCPRPLNRTSMYSGQNSDRRYTKPLITDNYSHNNPSHSHTPSHTPSPMTASTVRENGGIGEMMLVSG